MEKLNEICEILLQIEGDATVPKNAREKLKGTISALNGNKNLGVKRDFVMQQLDDISEDPNLPNHIRTQIWNVVSILESIK
jgi:uncharacterized protein (UPF0147 family)